MEQFKCPKLTLYISGIYTRLCVYLLFCQLFGTLNISLIYISSYISHTIVTIHFFIEIYLSNKRIFIKIDLADPKTITSRSLKCVAIVTADNVKLRLRTTKIGSTKGIT